MNTQHTPGEWKVRYMNAENTDDGECDFFVQAPKVNPKVACNIEIMQQDFGEHTGYPRKLKLADARLITAAPDLLTAAINALERLKEIESAYDVSIDPTLAELRSAIAKAMCPTGNERGIRSCNHYIINVN